MNFIKWFVFLIACIINCSACFAESDKDSVNKKLSAMISEWDKNALQAKRDHDLINDVIEAYSSQNPASENASINAVNAAILPINTRFPGVNIKYVSSSDFCPVLRRLREKQQYILNRWSDSSGQSAQMNLIVLFYEATKLKVGIEQFKGESFTEFDVEEIYNQLLPKVFAIEEMNPIENQKAWEESQRYSSDWKDPCE